MTDVDNISQLFSESQ